MAATGKAAATVTVIAAVRSLLGGDGDAVETMATARLEKRRRNGGDG